MKSKDVTNKKNVADDDVASEDIYRMDRRTFLKMAAATAGAVALGGLSEKLIGTASGSFLVPQTALPATSITKYVDTLPTFVGARVDGTTTTSTTPLRVTMEEFQEKVLPASIYAALPHPYKAGTYVWGYGITPPVGAKSGPLYPAFTIETKRGTATYVKYVNNLGTNTTFPFLQKYISVDQTIHWADPLGNMMLKPMVPYQGPVPAVAHLHGGEVPSTSDGGPDSWFTPGLVHTGPAWTQGVTDSYLYPNGQEATTLFFHDHALGATRLNLYCGLAGFYFIRDSFDTGLPNNPLNLPAGLYEIEIAIQDRMFDTNGQLLFPDGYPAGPNGPPPNPTVHPFWIPEFFGDVIVVNGKTWPFLKVEPRRYRLRFVNGSNARFYKLSLGPKLSFWVIGTDGGLLDAPVKVKELFIAPGERADVIVDFAPVNGATITMTNSAKAPYPSGASPSPSTVGQIMQFQVTLPLLGTDTSFNPATPGVTLRGGGLNQPPKIVRLADGLGSLAPGVTPDKTRLLTLNEIAGPRGPLEVFLNNTKWDGSKSPNAGLITENPQVGSTELWEIDNLTADAHPIHLHLVQFQLVNRQAFNATQYTKAYNALFPPVTFNGITYPGGVFIPEYGPPTPYNNTPKLGGNPDVTPYVSGPIMPPAPEEAGWKDTIKMFPGQVTRIVVRWAPQDILVGKVSAGTNLYPFDPKTGPGYPWHCHIVDHEDNEMMRPYKVVA